MDLPNHGGNIYSYKEADDLLDFSSNINPLGYPPKLKEEIIKRLDEVLRYPDVDYRKLKSNISEYLQVDKEYIQVGNGAVEILDMVISLFKRIVLVEPCFSEYRLRANVHDLEIVEVDLDDNLNLPKDILKESIREGDLVLLTNPHNPSGKTLRENDLLDIYTDVVEKNAYLLLDEAFYEFADISYDSISLFKKIDYSNIGIVRAATKFFGLPGIRLGYGVFEKEILEKLKVRELPWTVNTFSVIASDVIFDEDYIKKSMDYIFQERARYINKLKEIVGVYPYESNSNYVLLRLEDISEDYVFKNMLNNGILIRRCSNYNNLQGTHIRVAIKSKEENDILLENLKRIMEE